jgi:hypothetical protein
MLKAVLLKLDEATHARWTAAAKSLDESLSEWIRTQCNQALDGPPPLARKPKEHGSRTTLNAVAVEPAGRGKIALESCNIERLDAPREAHAKDCSCRLCSFRRDALG